MLTLFGLPMPFDLSCPRVFERYVLSSRVHETLQEWAERIQSDASMRQIRVGVPVATSVAPVITGTLRRSHVHPVQYTLSN